VPLAIEREFRFRLDPHTVVAGRWDRIDEQGGGIVLVDYKTKELEDGEKADQRARDSLRDDQLGLYALAYRESYGVSPARVELHFVGAGVVGSAVVEPRHLERARDRAREAAAGIRSARFPARPEARRCSFCPYSRFCVHSAARGLT